MSPLYIPSLPWPVSPLSCEDAFKNLAPELKPKDNNYFITSAESKPIIAPNNCDDSQPLITPIIEQPIKINSTGFLESKNYENKPKEQSSTKQDNLQMNTTYYKMTPKSHVQYKNEYDK